MYGNQDASGGGGPENDAQNECKQRGNTQYVDGDTYKHVVCSP